MRQRLKEMVMNNSMSSDFEKAKREWVVKPSIDEDELADTKCSCGHEGIRYIFTIRNSLNGNEITPVGSKCIKEFGSQLMGEQVSELEDMMKAYKEMKFNHVSLASSPKFCTRRLIDLSLRSSFITKSDYDFLVDVKMKRKLTSKQSKWRDDVFNKIGRAVVAYIDIAKTAEVILANVKERNNPDFLSSFQDAAKRFCSEVQDVRGLTNEQKIYIFKSKAQRFRI